MEVKEEEITLEDVETAIKVLEVFLARMRRAQLLLARIRPYTGRATLSYPMNLEDFIKLAVQMKRQAKEEEGEEVPELTREELERIRKIKEKIKKMH